MEETYIYALVGIDENDIRYIGQSKKPYLRLSQHKCSSSRESKIKKEWVKSLNGKIDMIILEKCSVEEGDFLERYYISLYKSWGFNLINDQSGGLKKYRQSQHRKKSMKESLDNYREEFGSSMKGKFHTEQTKEKLTQVKLISPILQFSLKGDLIKKWNYGYKAIGRALGKDSTGILDCLKGKLRKSLNSIWIYEKDFSEEELIRLINQTNKRRKESHTGILQFDLEGRFLKEWSFSEIKKTFTATSIINCLNGHQKTAYKSIWIYKEKCDNYGKEYFTNS